MFNHQLLSSLLLLLFIFSVKRSSFSTGFRFNYWSKKPKHLDKETAGKMTVKPVHDSLKEEVVGGGYLTNEQWENKVVLKARKYLKSQSVRKATAERARYGRSTGQNHSGSRLTEQHLFSIILYCDFSALCTAFSETFRLRDIFEDIESLKARHSKFAHFGRLLVETVRDFGINGHYQTSGFEKGPFFCGLNCPLNIGTYAIRLNGPCSTTTERAVAVNFAKSNGIILSLNNDTLSGQFEMFFDCSWISNFFEESERLWISGFRLLRIASIVIVRSARNYAKMMRALYLFDAMISAVDLKKCPIKEKQSDFDLLSSLFDWTLSGGDAASSELDSYLKNEWNLFLQKREYITLNIYYMSLYFESLPKLIMFNVVLPGWNGAAKDQDNVLKPEWLSMFPSLRTVDINMRSDYKFRLEALLETMPLISPSISIVVRGYARYESDKWMREGLSDEISAQFVSAGWNPEYEEENVEYLGINWKLVLKSISE